MAELSTASLKDAINRLMTDNFATHHIVLGDKPNVGVFLLNAVTARTHIKVNTVLYIPNNRLAIFLEEVRSLANQHKKIVAQGFRGDLSSLLTANEYEFITVDRPNQRTTSGRSRVYLGFDKTCLLSHFQSSV